MAARYSLSASGLAKRAGLDSTAFNKSKRQSADGRPRWPSTESLAKIIEATDSSLDEFFSLIEGKPQGARRGRCRVQASTVPLIGFAQAGAGGFFDDAGFPAGQGWDLIELPATAGDGSYALQVQGDSMLPLYRHGDMLVVQPSAAVRKGDRVVVKTTSGEVMAKVLERRTRIDASNSSRSIPITRTGRLAAGEVEWLARIVWASQ